ncbi:MAG: thymidine phosphorylase [Halocynthiibacter sp.]
MATARSVLLKLRQNTPLSPEDAAWFGRALGTDAISDAQAGAFAMGVCARGLSREARVALTMAMRDSGDVLTWDFEAPVLDKHSTGGVGDAVSLLLAPALAACGAKVPMISGRGLGHTGGTLDKLEAVDGVQTTLSREKFTDILQKTGCAIVGASGDIAPADKRLYGVRDVTGTVQSVDLVTSSILSKKLAAGLDALVLDVKFGAGAVMPDIEDARALAVSLVETAQGAGLQTTAFLTNMDQPLVPAIGNTLELAALRDVLVARDMDHPILQVVLRLGAAVMELGKMGSREDALTALSHAFETGAAAHIFDDMICEMGATYRPFSGETSFPKASVQLDVTAPEAGYLSELDAVGLGQSVVALGGGREQETDVIDPTVGLNNILRLGAYVEAGGRLATIHAANEAEAKAVMTRVKTAFYLTENAPIRAPLILEEVHR